MLRHTAADAAHSIGWRFAEALATRDTTALLSLLECDVDFRGMTPSRVWEAHSPDATVQDVLFGCWFEPSDVIERVEAVETATVGNRHRLGYRLQVKNGYGKFIVEQQAFFDLADNKITWLRMLCSGFRPITDCA